MGAPQAAPQPTYTANRPPAPGGAAPPQPGSYGQVAAGVQQKLAQQYGGTAPETGTAGRTKEQIHAERAAEAAARRPQIPGWRAAGAQRAISEQLTNLDRAKARDPRSWTPERQQHYEDLKRKQAELRPIVSQL
jgi:hypothetical protein